MPSGPGTPTGRHGSLAPAARSGITNACHAQWHATSRTKIGFEHYMSIDIIINPAAGLLPAIGNLDAPAAFHRRLPGYTPTPLVAAPTLAAQLGLGQIWVKQESCRLGMPAFKILGASWAIYRALERQLGQPLAGWATLADLREKLVPLLPITLAAATDGDHGRGGAYGQPAWSAIKNSGAHRYGSGTY